MSKLSGEIRFIQWGIIPGLPYRKIEVGQDYGGTKMPMKVLGIVSEHIVDNVYEYHVECSLKDSKGVLIGEPFKWKTFHLKPDEIEYFGPDEKHNYLKV